MSGPIPAAGEVSALARLLEAEQRLDAILADAAERAAAVVRAAERDAKARVAALDREIATAVDQLTARLADERRGRLQRLEAEADRTLAALAVLDDKRVDTLAQQVVTLVLDGESAAAVAP